MLLKLFKSHQPFSIVLIPIINILLWLPIFINPPDYSIYLNDYAPFAGYLIKSLNFFPLSSIIIANIFVLISAFYVNKINLKHVFIEKRTYLPAYIYVFVFAFFLTSKFLIPLSFSLLFILFSFDKILVIRKERNILKPYFESGILAGISSLFIVDSLLFFIVIWIAIMLTSHFYWREYLMTVLGLILPIFFLFAYYYFTNNTYFFQTTYFSILNPQSTLILNFKALYFGSILSFFTLISLFHLFFYSKTKKTTTRGQYKLFFWTIVLFIIGFVLFEYQKPETLYIIIIPISYIISNFFISSNQHNWIKEFLFALFISGIVVLYI